MNRSREGKERFAERRAREDAAPRLKDVVPALTSCTMTLAERRVSATIAETSHIRRVVVEHAPALFIVPCGDASCRDGGHDITTPVLHGLRDGRTEIRGEDSCTGATGSAACERILAFTIVAEYRS